MSAAATPSRTENPPSDPLMAPRTVESLLRRLVDQVEEKEHRYSDALDELHGRLDRLAQTRAPAQALASPEETETLERLRSQLAALARRLEPPQEDELRLDDFAKFGRALCEAREVAAGLTAEEPRHFALPAAASDRFAGTGPAFSFAMPNAEPSHAAPAFMLPPLPTPEPDFGKRLVDVAQQLERSIGEAMPAAAIETLNKRMADIAARFEAALEHTPKIENLQQLERQIADMGQQLGRVEQQVARVTGIESQLQRLIERCDEAPAQMEQAASRAAENAARLVADMGLGKPSAAERIDAIHRDLVAMNERSRATDDRLADTLVAVHASLKDLVHQVERVRSPAPVTPRATSMPGMASGEAPPVAAGAAPRAEKFAMPNAGEESRSRTRTLRDRLGAEAPASEEAERPMAPFGRARRASRLDEAVDLDEAETGSRRSMVIRYAGLDPGSDFVAAARRAAQNAATRAEERGSSRPRIARGSEQPTVPAGTELPERRQRSMLMVAAALLLVVSAALLYSRLQSKPEAEMAPAATEQSVPAPAAPFAPAPETAPAPTASPEPEAAPEPETTARPFLEEVPEPAPEGAQAPGADAPPVAAPPANATTPPAAASGSEPPAVRVSEAPTVIAAGLVTASGVSEIAEAAVDAPAEAMPTPQLAALSTNAETALPQGVSMSVGGRSLPARLTMPAPELGTPALRQAAADGDVQAEYAIAARYAQGQGSARALTPNWTEAALWFGLAASAGFAPAQYRLAVLYERGDGVTKDLGRAQSWYARAAEQGNVKAMHNLAVAASSGQGRGADYALAAKWYAAAAAYGLADSQFNLGILAGHGLGMAKDLPQAFKWFSLAAATGDAEAARRRDLVKAELASAQLALAEQAVKAWHAKPEIAEANAVPEQASWRAENEAPTKDLVARAQALLGKLGYDAGSADGETGARTREAVRSFERRNGLEETGEVTRPLVTKLERLTS